MTFSWATACRHFQPDSRRLREWGAPLDSRKAVGGLASAGLGGSAYGGPSTNYYYGLGVDVKPKHKDANNKWDDQEVDASDLASRLQQVGAVEPESVQGRRSKPKKPKKAGKKGRKGKKDEL